MSWPPDELWPKIAALGATHGAPSASAGERAKAFATLKQYQHDFDLTDCQLAYIAEHEALNPGSRIFRRERPANAFEITLAAIDEIKLVMPFEHLVIDSAWILHTYVFSQFLHTPRLLIHSRGSGYGKTVRLNVIKELANQCFYMVAPTPPVLYHHLQNRPLSTLALDDAERMDWGRKSLMVQIIDAGHRQGAPIPRVLDHKVVLYPRFDDIVPGDPRFVPVRAVIARWAETFQRPKTSISLPPRIRARCANNYYALAAVADSLGYGATLRAAAVAIEAAGFDPEIQLYQDIHLAFEQQQVDRLWADELVQSLKEIGDMWALLTNSVLYDQLWKRGIEYRTVWKVSVDGSRKSGNGFYCKQFEAVWHELLGIEHTDTQSRKITQIAAHKRHTGDTHDD
jgi:hypothetical protein